MATSPSIKDAIRIAGDLATIAAAVAQYAHKGELKRVEEILPKQMLTSIARIAAEERARSKFGGSKP